MFSKNFGLARDRFYERAVPKFQHFSRDLIIEFRRKAYLHVTGTSENCTEKPLTNERIAWIIDRLTD